MKKSEKLTCEPLKYKKASDEKAWNIRRQVMRKNEKKKKSIARGRYGEKDEGKGRRYRKQGLVPSSSL